MAITPTQYRLSPETLDQLDRIAAHLSDLTRTPQSRAAAIRYAAHAALELLDAPRLTPPEVSRKKSGKNIRNNA